jgi:hypothetical protein
MCLVLLTIARTAYDYLRVIRGIPLSERRDFQAALQLLKVERH